MTVAAPTALGRPALFPWVGREAVAIAVPVLLAAMVVAALPATLGQDAWLALVAGREISSAGLPGAERLTLAAAGSPWVDQQWLAQLVLYGIAAAGGTGAALALNAALVVGAFAAACVAARRLGGSPVAVGAVAGACALTAPWAWQLRSQSLAYPLFVALVWLLVSDGRRRSHRVLLVLPLLLLWANLHGSVVLAAGLVAVHALVTRRAALAAAPLAVFASPYAGDLPGYYRRTLLDSDLARYVTEWQSPFLSLAGLPAVVLVVFVAAMLVRLRRRLPTAEAGLLLVLLGAAALAARNAVWLQLAAVVLLPGALRLGAGGASRAVRHALLAATLAILVAAIAATAGRPVEQAWPATASKTVATAIAADPELRVLADDRHADWLLWEVPSVAGRLGYDVRFELYGNGELDRYARFLRAEPGWREVARGYGLVVVGRDREPLVRALAADPGFAAVVEGDVLVFRSRA